MGRLLLPLEQGPRTAREPADDPLLYSLKRLPRRAQQVFLLNRLDQLDYATIARRLDLPISTVEQLMLQVLQSTRLHASSLSKLASRWYVRLQSPAATACERIDFRRWLDASAEHLQAFHDTELHWRSLLPAARELGEDGNYRHGRAALSLGGCSLVVGVGLAVLAAFGLWA